MMSPTIKTTPSKPQGHSLGLRTRDPLKIIRKLNQGLPFKAFQQFQSNSGFQTSTLAAFLGCSASTLARRRKLGKFTSLESERLQRLASLFEKCMASLDITAGETREWLESPQVAFGGITPIKMAETELGAREVENLVAQTDSTGSIPHAAAVRIVELIENPPSPTPAMLKGKDLHQKLIQPNAV